MIPLLVVALVAALAWALWERRDASSWREEALLASASRDRWQGVAFQKSEDFYKLRDAAPKQPRDARGRFVSVVTPPRG